MSSIYDKIIKIFFIISYITPHPVDWKVIGNLTPPLITDGDRLKSN